MRRGAIVGMVIYLLMASYAWGQGTRSDRADEETEAPVPETPAAPPGLGAPIPTYPVELLGLLAPPTRRGLITLTPSIAVSEEYNDNIFFDNRNRQWDFITNFSPALVLLADRPTYRLSAGYTLTGQLYARESRFNNALERQTFLLNSLYRPAPQFTLTASDTYERDRNTHVVAPQGFATERQEAWSNAFTPGMAWRVTPRTFLGLTGTYSVLRFEGAGSGIGSDTYTVQTNLGHTLTPRLTGIVGYGFTYLDLHSRQENSTTHTPTLGVIYRITPTLTGSVSGGPAITTLGGETFVTPAGTAILGQALRFGSVTAQYRRAVEVAGGFGGTTDTQTVSGALTLTTLVQGLIVAFRPAYSIAESVSSRQTGHVNVRAFTVNLGVSYQIARFTSIFGEYSFLQQRTGGSSAMQTDVDQNRVRFGLQFGYPINFD